MSKKKKIGVVVGRFQIDVLHVGHATLLNYVQDRNDALLVVLGSRDNIDERNLLDYETRKCLIKSMYPYSIVEKLLDVDGNDKKWSENLDNIIDNIIDKLGEEYEVTIYGGRDSFIDYYDGKYYDNYIEVDEVPDVNATELREYISNNVIDNPLFRYGVIYGLTNYFKQQKKK